MRERMRENLSKARQGQFDLKQDAGGVADLEFLVQYWMLEWADLIFVMDDHQREALERMFPDDPALARIVCLQIADEYPFLDGELVRLLEERVGRYLNSR